MYNLYSLIFKVWIEVFYKKRLLIFLSVSHDKFDFMLNEYIILQYDV